MLFLEIDGLGHEVLTRAMRDGNAPNLARWVQDGSHHLVRWETDWSSQTGAAQTGLLLGSNENIPAFRWWDKEQGRAVASSAPKDVLAIEASLSTGKGLLYADGASRSNMYSGDAVHSSLTIATLRQQERHHERRGQGYLAYFSNPFAMVRTIVLMVGDMIKEWWNAAEQKRLDVWPRGHRGFVYSLLRAFMVVVQRDLAMSAVIGDIYAGRPVVYATFSGYDEVAHHSGIERPDALAVLRNLDQTFDRIARATHDAPRPFHIVVLSDHGQSQGPTFFQRYGTTLEEIVAEAARAEVVSSEMGDEGMMHLNVTMTAAATGGGAVGVIAKPFAKSTDEDAMTAASEDLAAVGADGKELPEVVTLASGNLGLISFPRIPHRVTLEELDERYPHVIPALCAHPGVAFMVVRSSKDGPVAIGDMGRHYLDDGRIVGERSAGAVRRERRGEGETDGRLPARRGHHGELDVLGRARGGRRLRGAHRLARRHGRPAAVSVRPRPGRVRAPGSPAARAWNRAQLDAPLARRARPRGLRRRARPPPPSDQRENASR